MRPMPRSATARRAGAEQGRSDVRDDLVDEAGAQERGGQRRAAFEPDVLPRPASTSVAAPAAGSWVGSTQGLGARRRGRARRRARSRIAHHDAQRLPVGGLGVGRARRGRSAAGRRRATVPVPTSDGVALAPAAGGRRRAPRAGDPLRACRPRRPTGRRAWSANFQVTNGRRWRIANVHSSLIALGLVGEHARPRPRSRPRAARRRPRAAAGLGSGWANTTRRTPASISASAHGPVRPVWLHGSSVTTAVPPRARSPAASQGVDLGMRAARRRGGSPRRRPRRRRRGRRRRRAGWGRVATPGVQASASARRIARISLSLATAVASCRLGRSSRAPGVATGDVRTRAPRYRATESRRRRGATRRASSHPDFHRRSRNFTGSTDRRAAAGSRTVTAGSEFHRPRSTRELVTLCNTSMALRHQRVTTRPPDSVVCRRATSRRRTMRTKRHDGSNPKNRCSMAPDR